ncbi:MAG: hypothetical protein LC808_10625 [Actinobacteria bacterium]|nr:hypothetical protein [Actinomycetota bacterium]
MSLRREQIDEAEKAQHLAAHDTSDHVRVSRRPRDGQVRDDRGAGVLAARRGKGGTRSCEEPGDGRLSRRDLREPGAAMPRPPDPRRTARRVV